MVEEKKHVRCSDTLTVPGLRNVGKTCYVAAVLQALASCSSLIQQLQLACNTLECLVDPSDTSFTSVLLDCLLSLQPVRGFSVPSQSPAAVLCALRQRIGSDILAEGQEHDASEAYEIMMELVSAELHHAFNNSIEVQRQRGFSLAAVLPDNDGIPCFSAADIRSSSACSMGESLTKPAIHGDKGAAVIVDHAHGSVRDGRQCRIKEADLAATSGTFVSGVAGCPTLSEVKQRHTLSSHGLMSGSGQPHAGIPEAGKYSHNACFSVESDRAHVSRQHHEHADTFADYEEGCSKKHLELPGDPVMCRWRSLARLVCQGSIASQMTCLTCRHRFASQLTPFLLLPLSIPLGPGHTLAGNHQAAQSVSLERCLQESLGLEAVHGVECTRCSLHATINNKDIGMQMQRYAAMLKNSATLLECDLHKQLALNEGPSWTPVFTQVAKQTLMAQMPRLLSVQLKRVVWAAAGAKKISGFIKFPAILHLSSNDLSYFGHDRMPRLQSRYLSNFALPSGNNMHLGHLYGAFKYRLCAVVVHHGIAGSGHYTVHRSSTEFNTNQWQTVSDESVMNNVCLDDVLHSEATLLLYERVTHM